MSEPHPKSTDTHRMMICPGCEKEIKVLNEYLGLKIECTICGKRFKARILDDEKRRSKRAERVKAALKAAEAKKAAQKAAEAMKAAASQRLRRPVDFDNRILERAAHGDLRGHVVPAEGVEDLLDSPEAHAPEPTPETKGERDFHLITIRGKPLWIGVTLAVMALSVVSYLATRPDRDSSPGVASLPPTPPIPPHAKRPTETDEAAPKPESTASAPIAEQAPETDLQAERSATRGLLAVLTTTQWPEPEFGVELRAPEPPLVCAQISGADRILRAHGWRLGNLATLDDFDLPGEYTLEYSRSVGGARLAARLIGDDSRVIVIAMNGLVGSISSAAEHSEAKRKAWELCITTAKALLPDVEPTVVESRADGEDKAYWMGGEAVTSSGWRVITKDYEYDYRGRPPTEGDWVLMLHLSRD